MSMYKGAQLNLADDDMVIALPEETEVDHEVVLYQDMPSADEVVEMHAPEGEAEITFHLPFLPGADDLVEVLSDDLAVETNKEEDKKEKDKSKASDQPKDLNWAKQYIDNVPKHKGENLGLERSKSYLNRGLGMLSKMLQEDHEGKIDISKAEDARIVMENGIERLEKELAKRTQKKKASVEASGLTKEGQKIAGVGGIIVTVPLKISRIARVCINATISAGKDMEDMVSKQSSKWKLDDNEQADLIQLIQDMGYIVRRDRGFMVNDKNPYERSSENNFDFPPNYNA
jgi:hypothetical protein